jgi:hypothetical protein
LGLGQGLSAGLDVSAGFRLDLIHPHGRDLVLGVSHLPEPHGGYLGLGLGLHPLVVEQLGVILVSCLAHRGGRLK